MSTILWKDRKRTFLGLPWSFTKYSLSEERLFIDSGFFKTVSDEVRLYRILDMQLVQTFGQKLLGVGTIKVCSSDKSMGDFEIKNVKKPRDVKELLSEAIEKQRDLKRVVNREIMTDSGHEHDFNDNDFDDDVETFEHSN
ncbi:MAG: PH domain-containing protein [Lachnospiraceae bacterium]|nr:PH domain-containing protein [Lachnospiraceae bacterium]